MELKKIESNQECNINKEEVVSVLENLIKEYRSNHASGSFSNIKDLIETIHDYLEFEGLEEENEKRGGIAISCHTFYEWVEENVNNIKLSLFKAIITNIVPLGEIGKTFFKFIANLRIGFTDELLKLYDSAEKRYKQGKLEPIPCWVMYELGYTGEVMKNDCPVYDVLEFLSKHE